MGKIFFESVRQGDIELCRVLCDELMAYQKSKAIIAPDIFDQMNFDTRMKKSSENACDSHVVLAKDGIDRIGYVFSTVDYVTEDSRAVYPEWAPQTDNSIGFYPDWVHLPQKIGCLSNLYLRDGYRGCGVGAELYRQAEVWLKGFPDVELIFVFISNGNDAALDFYLKQGFMLSHDVFGGFIKAAYMRV